MKQTKNINICRILIQATDIGKIDLKHSRKKKDNKLPRNRFYKETGSMKYATLDNFHRRHLD